MATSFVFVGNRRFVLERMIAEELNVAQVFAVAGTHLERDLQHGMISGVSDYFTISSKRELLQRLEQSSYDVLVSNGCPYILPVSKLPAAHYVNIHPSCLPDLRGVDPVIGSILHKRDGGATCHVMDAGIDTGDIISSVRIPFSSDLDVTTLYQLSFIAEQDAFSQALVRNFEPQRAQPDDPDAIYYTRSAEDQRITFQEGNDLILQKVKAFNNRSQGCAFNVKGTQFRVFSAQRMQNPFINKALEGFPECVVGLSYENGIVFRKDGEIIRFLEVQSEGGEIIAVGSSLLQP
ncbi:formyltransferase family protein [uncultured Roseibium sp.]|uniref:formyltransferase family protein n=1 Tax=uncultured Roseibium sp. TaxID=1936171 RepID=UPI00260BEC9D|nr:formyltransferase family protein [uncultured Roseibium sp.]